MRSSKPTRVWYRRTYPIFSAYPAEYGRVKKVSEDVFMQYPGTTVINLIDHSRLVRSKADTELKKLNELSGVYVDASTHDLHYGAAVAAQP